MGDFEFSICYDFSAFKYYFFKRLNCYVIFNKYNKISKVVKTNFTKFDICTFIEAITQKKRQSHFWPCLFPTLNLIELSLKLSRESHKFVFIGMGRYFCEPYLHSFLLFKPLSSFFQIPLHPANPRLEEQL